MDVHPTKNVSIGINPYPSRFKMDFSPVDGLLSYAIFIQDGYTKPWPPKCQACAGLTISNIHRESQRLILSAMIAP
jgi:hypothetical protein